MQLSQPGTMVETKSGRLSKALDILTALFVSFLFISFTPDTYGRSTLFLAGGSEWEHHELLFPTLYTKVLL